MASSAKHRCHNCRAVVPDGNLYCSASCVKDFAEARHSTKNALLASGFIQHDETKNSYSKRVQRKGKKIIVVTSIQECLKHGVEEAIEKAESAAINRSEATA